MAYVKDLEYLQLFDTYGALLTELQREICEEYYLYDLSLSEIAEGKNITRQAVSDALKKSREQFVSYEQKLKVVGRQRALLAAIERLKEEHPQLIEKLDAISDMVASGEGANLDEEK